ncbi:hypothetical protein LINPERPRIM_LOCUS23683, partial [Linum perenne]
VFFPIYGGPTLQHFYVFVIDLRNKQRIVLNSVECDKDFDIVPQYKATFTHLVEYLQPLLLEHCKKDVSNYQQRVFDAPRQSDISSCGMFTLYFMEHFVGRFSPQHRSYWARSENVLQDRQLYVNHLISSPDNALRK